MLFYHSKVLFVCKRIEACAVHVSKAKELLFYISKVLFNQK